MSDGLGRFLLLSINHEHVPLDEREGYSLDARQVETLYQALRERKGIEESLILNTCNRFELYTYLNGNPANEDPLVQTLSGFYQLDEREVRNHAKFREGQNAIQHLIEVSAGLRSQITGEAEVFGQVKSAYSQCSEFGGAASVINRIFQRGFQAAKLIRQSTQIGEGQISISSVAVDLSHKIFGRLDKVSILILGTGDIGEKTAKALNSRGASRFGIASRDHKRAIQAASDWGGKALLLDDLDAYLRDYDILIASSMVDRPVVTKAASKKALGMRKGRPLFFIDLGMPRNIDPSCQDLDNLFLYNLDDLASIAEENLQTRRNAMRECEKIAATKSAAIWESLRKRGLL